MKFRILYELLFLALMGVKRLSQGDPDAGSPNDLPRLVSWRGHFSVMTQHGCIASQHPLADEFVAIDEIQKV